jgi:hypothetical protein
MASTSSPGSGLISITVEVSSQGGNKTFALDNIPSSMSVGELKTQLKVRPNSRFGRLNKFENWDNRRPLSDYFVKSGEQFMCVIQCVIEEGQHSFDDYNEWLSTNKKTLS